MNHINRTTLKAHEIGVLERPRYFPRQLITPVEMTLEQSYFRDKLRRHNRLLHGWGVVVGAEVCAVRNTANNSWEPWKVRIQPGYVLGPVGDEIIISKERVLDLRVGTAVGGPEGLSNEMNDPWCRPVYQDNLPEWIYIAVRYREVMTRQVRVQPAGCGCDDSSCEYSRICDGYEFGILPSCPPSHQDPPLLADLATLLSTGASLEVPDEDWVVLAAVRLDPNGRILIIDNCSCRRVVASLASVWSRCASDGLSISKLDPSEMEQGKEYDVVINGSGFQEGATIDMGPWATISNLNIVNIGEMKFHVLVSNTAPVGEQTLMLMNPDCSLAITPIRITEKPADAADKEKNKRGKKDR